MILLIGEITVVLILILLLWISFKYIALIISKKNADIFFNKISKELILYYDFVKNFLSENEKVFSARHELIVETYNLIAKALTFNVKQDGNERIIGFANAIMNNVEEIILQTDNNEEFKKNYYNHIQNFTFTINKYNNARKILKHYVDVFPTSFIARLKNIKTMDEIK